VPFLEREDLQHGVGQDVGDTEGDGGLPTVVEAFAVDLVLDVIVAGELGSADVERGQPRSGVLAFGLEDAAGLNLVGLAQELHQDGDAVDVAGPPEAGLLLVEQSLLKVVLQSAVSLRRLVGQREPDDDVDIGGADMRPGSLGKSPGQVPGGQAASQVDPLAPWPDVAQERQQRPLAALGRLLVVVAEMLAAQNPITSCRRCAACSGPRRGSRRRSAYTRNLLASHSPATWSRNASGASSLACQNTTL
jgi:hypothetical protein